MPYEVGLRLGAIWERQTFSIPLGGNLARFKARAFVVTAIVDTFEPVDLAFAWTMDRNAPLILGHINFFQAFDVCFYRADLEFEISPRRILSQSTRKSGFNAILLRGQGAKYYHVRDYSWLASCQSNSKKSTSAFSIKSSSDNGGRFRLDTGFKISNAISCFSDSVKL